MSAPATTRRRALVAELLRSYQVPSQAALAELLVEHGVRADQSTLSRDLRELGVVKSPDGYVLAGETAQAASPGLEAALGQWLLTATPAQNQVVLKTPPGGAQPLAVALDATRHDSIVGTLAGDDTILVICPDAKHAGLLAAELLAGANP